MGESGGTSESVRRPSSPCTFVGVGTLNSSNGISLLAEQAEKVARTYSAPGVVNLLLQKSLYPSACLEVPPTSTSDQGVSSHDQDALEPDVNVNAESVATSPLSTNTPEVPRGASNSVLWSFLPGFILREFVPRGTFPPGFVPRGTVLRGTVPRGTVPRGTVPRGTVPRGTVPRGSFPPGFIPREILPRGLSARLCARGPERRALLISHNLSSHHEDRLIFPEADVDRFKECLITLGVENRKIQVVKVESDSQLTYFAFEQFFGTAIAGDNLILFISGYASYTPNGFVHFMCYNAKEFCIKINALPDGCHLEMFIESSFSTELAQLQHSIKQIQSRDTTAGMPSTVPMGAATAPLPGSAPRPRPPHSLRRSSGPGHTVVRPNFILGGNTGATVVLWAASEWFVYEGYDFPGEKARNSVVVNAFCTAIEKGLRLRGPIWEVVEHMTSRENETRTDRDFRYKTAQHRAELAKDGPRDQCPHLRSTCSDGPRVLEGEVFCNLPVPGAYLD